MLTGRLSERRDSRVGFLPLPLSEAGAGAGGGEYARGTLTTRRLSSSSSWLSSLLSPEMLTQEAQGSLGQEDNNNNNTTPGRRRL